MKQVRINYRNKENKNKGKEVKFKMHRNFIPSL